jgi:hypothetical protein
LFEARDPLLERQEALVELLDGFDQRLVLFALATERMSPT